MATFIYRIYIYYVFATDLDAFTCLSKTLKVVRNNFLSFSIVSIVCDIAIAIAFSLSFCLFPILIVKPMAELYMQNYIHYKGMVRARELA